MTKQKLAILTAVISLSAQSSPVLSCQGQLGGKPVHLEVFKTPGIYQGQFVLESDGNTQVVDAKGGSFTECGTRTEPCQMFTSTQYTSEEPNLILTALYTVGSSKVYATLNAYPDGFGQASVDGKVLCEVGKP